MFQDYYKLLDLPNNLVNQIIGNDLQPNNYINSPHFLSDFQIKEFINIHWKKQAHINHPDKGGDIELMKVINQAKECLILKDKRIIYNSKYIDNLLLLLDQKFPITHIIGNKKYHIPNPDITGDGSIDNMFSSKVKQVRIMDRIIIR